jgi:hypothetical protein
MTANQMILGEGVPRVHLFHSASSPAVNAINLPIGGELL